MHTCRWQQQSWHCIYKWWTKWLTDTQLDFQVWHIDEENRGVTSLIEAMFAGGLTCGEPAWLPCVDSGRALIQSLSPCWQTRVSWLSEEQNAGIWRGQCQITTVLWLFQHGLVIDCFSLGFLWLVVVLLSIQLMISLLSVWGMLAQSMNTPWYDGMLPVSVVFVRGLHLSVGRREVYVCWGHSQSTVCHHSTEGSKQTYSHSTEGCSSWWTSSS